MNTSDYLVVDNLTNDLDSETYMYNVSYSPFKIIQYANGVETMIINKNNSLGYETGPPANTNDDQ